MTDRMSTDVRIDLYEDSEGLTQAIVQWAPGGAFSNFRVVVDPRFVFTHKADEAGNDANWEDYKRRALEHVEQS